MVTASRTMEVEFTARDAGVSRVTDQVRRSIGSVGTETDRTDKKTRSGFSNMRAAVAGFAGGVGSQLAGRALDGVINFAQQSIRATSDMQETLSKSRAIFGDQAGSVERWASGGSRAFGLAKADALAYAASLGDMASQIGLTGKESAAFGQDLVQVSADLGSFNNLETGDVLDRISAALRGEYDSLQAIIPNINAARVEQEALTATGKKAAKELTAQDKALAVQAILHKDGARAMGDFARTSGGFANQQKIAAAQVADLQAKLGAFLLPILTTVMTFITSTAIPAITEFANGTGAGIVPALGEAGAALQTILPFIGQLAAFIAENIKVLGPLTAGLVLLNVVLSANPISLVVIALGALVAGLIYAYQNSEDFRRVVDAVFLAVRTTVTTVVDAVTRALSSVVGWTQDLISGFIDMQRRVIGAISALGRGVIDGVQTMRDRAIRFVTDLRDKFVRANVALRDGAVRAVLQLRDRVVSGVTQLRDRAVAFAVSLRDRFVAANRLLRDRAVGAIVQLRDRVVAYVTSLRDRAMAYALSLRDRFIAAARALRDRAVEAVAALRDRVMSRVVDLRDRAVRAALDLRDRVLSPFRTLRDKAVDIFSGLRDSVGRAFGGLLGKVKGPLRDVFSWLNKNLLKPLNSVTSKFGLNIPDLPRFHRGTSRVGGRGEVPALLLPDEAVLNPGATRRLGRDTIDRLNRGEGIGGPGDWWNNFTEFISKPAKLVQRMAEQGVKWAVSQVMSAIPNAPQSGVPIADIVPDVLNGMKSRALEWAAGKESQLAEDLSLSGGGSIGRGPWVKPVAARVGNGYLGYPGHYGVDFPAATGTPVHAVSNGIITKAASLIGSYGRHIFARHADGLVTVYAHLSRIGASVGQAVRAGQVIGAVGSTGNSTGPHLHFETRTGGGYPGPNPRSVMAARGVRFDSGGMLPPGLSMVVNGTGGPEPVFTGQQWSKLERGMSANDRPTTVINLYGVIDSESAAREIRRLMANSDARNGGIRVQKRAVSR